MKEMRLAGVSDMATAQAFMPGFMAPYNAQFAVAPHDAEDAHRYPRSAASTPRRR